MASADVESYRQHQVWEVLKLKSDALSTTRFGSSQLEQSRLRTIKILRSALRSRSNTAQPHLYPKVLDELRDVVNNIQTDEYAFSNFMNSYEGQLAAYVRSLPGPPAKNMPAAYVEQIDAAVRLREKEITTLKEEVATLRQQLAEQEASLEAHGRTISQQEQAVSAAREQIEEVASATEETVNKSFQAMLLSWRKDRDEKDAGFNERMEAQVSLLTAAAQVGQRLTEHAAGNLTAVDWASRATRERRNGFGLRLLAIVFGFAGLALAYYIVDRAVKQDFDLTVGDGLLRGAAIIAVIAVGGYFAAESRRHYAESDTAEEVATAMLAIEPYYAGASDDDRTAARNAVGETVFVKNVLSRFTSRDAGRHNEAVSSQDLSQIVDELTKALKAAQTTQKPDASA